MPKNIHDQGKKLPMPKNTHDQGKKLPMPKAITTKSKTTAKEDLNIAITKLMLELKGEGTVSLLADQLGVPRKTLSLALRTCQDMEEKKMSSAEYFEMKRKEQYPEFPPTKILWEITSLIKVADAMRIRVSELISAAEEVQDGLPPWFKMRIKQFAAPQTQDELNNVFLEAVGCRTYCYSPAEALSIIGKRKSLRGSSEDLFSYSEISSLKFLADYLFEHPELEEFTRAYRAGAISPQDAYRVLKKAVDNVCRQFNPIPLHHRWGKSEEDRRAKTIQLLEHLRKNKAHLVDAIYCECRPFLQEKAKK